jgi:hypothetical protein
MIHEGKYQYKNHAQVFGAYLLTLPASDLLSLEVSALVCVSLRLKK